MADDDFIHQDVPVNKTWSAERKWQFLETQFAAGAISVEVLKVDGKLTYRIWRKRPKPSARVQPVDTTAAARISPP